jgi:hypothetical protein
MQTAANQANIGASEAFGLVAPGSIDPNAGLPTATEYGGGVTGYSSYDMYKENQDRWAEEQPGAFNHYNSLFVDPQTGARPMNFSGSSGSGGGKGGGGGAAPAASENRWVDKASHIMDTTDYERTAGEAEARANYLNAQANGTAWDTPRGYTPAETTTFTNNANTHTDTQGTLPTYTLGGGSSGLVDYRISDINVVGDAPDPFTPPPTNIGNPFGYR